MYIRRSLISDGSILSNAEIDQWLYVEKTKQQQKNQAHRYREQIGGCQSMEVECGQNIQIAS